jgi:dipeptidase E
MAWVRLYLSSFRMGDHPERLLALMDGRSAAVIANSIDSAPADVRAQGAQREIDALAELGIEAAEVDLRAYPADPDGVAAALAGHALVWVRGGNTFDLRRALAASGGDDAIVELIAADRAVYGGYSAGCCVLAPSLRGLELVDPVGEPPRFDGLGVLDRPFVPHCASPGHPETEACDRLAAHYTDSGIAHYALRDGQAIVVDGGAPELVRA